MNNSQFPSSEPPACGVDIRDIVTLHDQKPFPKIEVQDNPESYNDDVLNFDDFDFCDDNGIFGIDWDNSELDITQFLCEPNGSGVIKSTSSSPVSAVLDEQITAAPKNKVNHWTQDEHKLFLLGLRKYENENGRWKKISRDFVKTKIPIQVASHAQKFFKRRQQKSTTTKRKQRASIHDIDKVNNADILDLLNKRVLSRDLAFSFLNRPPQPFTHAQQHPVQNAPIHHHHICQPLAEQHHHVQNAPIHHHHICQPLAEQHHHVQNAPVHHHHICQPFAEQHHHVQNVPNHPLHHHICQPAEQHHVQNVPDQPLHRLSFETQTWNYLPCHQVAPSQLGSTNIASRIGSSDINPSFITPFNNNI